MAKKGLTKEVLKFLKESNADQKKIWGEHLKKMNLEFNQRLNQKIKLIENEEDKKNKLNIDLNLASFWNRSLSVDTKVYNAQKDLFFKVRKGYNHPLNLVIEKFSEWLYANNYYQTNYSIVTTNEYNFERLNIDQNHPARDMHDSIYINDQQLLKTHNTSITAIELEKNFQKKIEAFNHFTIGYVFRNDEDDATHSHQFLQLDFFSIGKTHNILNLMSILTNLLSYVFEKKVELRFRSSYFPFTEPSLEVDVFFNGKWLEILGAGMLNYKVLEIAGYKNNTRGFAAGIGLERIAMIKYGIDNIRDFYQNDIRFLNVEEQQ